MNLRNLAWIFAGAATLWTSAAGAQLGPPRPGPRCLPGHYDGGQMEMATQLDLTADHRFRYMLSYGALDEGAEGKWELDPAGKLLLTSDPTTPPRFTLLSEKPASAAVLKIALDLPRGISRQYFSAILRFADGRSSVRQFGDDGLEVELAADERPVAVTLLLPVLSLGSEVFPLSAPGGADLHIRFDPNDLGKVDFQKTALRIEQEDLLLERHDRLIRYRRDGEGC